MNIRRLPATILILLAASFALQFNTAHMSGPNCPSQLMRSHYSLISVYVYLLCQRAADSDQFDEGEGVAV